MIPQQIKTRLAELATFPEKYSLQELAEELHKLSLKCSHESGGEFKFVVFYSPRWCKRNHVV